MISSPRTGVVAFVAALLLVTSALSHFSSPMLVDASSISSAATDFDDGVKVTYSAGGARIVERRLQSKYDELCSDCKLFTVTPTLEFILRAFKFVTDMEECLHVTIWYKNAGFSYTDSALAFSPDPSNGWAKLCDGYTKGMGANNVTVVPEDICEPITVSPPGEISFSLQAVGCSCFANDDPHKTPCEACTVGGTSYHNLDRGYTAYTDTQCAAGTPFPASSPVADTSPTASPAVADSAHPSGSPTGSPVVATSAHPSDLPSSNPVVAGTSAPTPIQVPAGQGEASFALYGDFASDEAYADNIYNGDEALFNQAVSDVANGMSAFTDTPNYMTLESGESVKIMPIYNSSEPLGTNTAFCYGSDKPTDLSPPAGQNPDTPHCKGYSAFCGRWAYAYSCYQSEWDYDIANTDTNPKYNPRPYANLKCQQVKGNTTKNPSNLQCCPQHHYIPIGVYQDGTDQIRFDKGDPNYYTDCNAISESTGWKYAKAPHWYCYPDVPTECIEVSVVARTGDPESGYTATTHEGTCDAPIMNDIIFGGTGGPGYQVVTKISQKTEMCKRCYIVSPAASTFKIDSESGLDPGTSCPNDDQVWEQGVSTSASGGSMLYRSWTYEFPENPVAHLSHMQAYVWCGELEPKADTKFGPYCRDDGTECEDDPDAGDENYPGGDCTQECELPLTYEDCNSKWWHPPSGCETPDTTCVAHRPWANPTQNVKLVS